LRPGHWRIELSHGFQHRQHPEEEYAGEEYADYDAEDRKQPSVPAEIPGDEPEDGVLEQRREVLYGGGER
jgi:hypothetical protein